MTSRGDHLHDDDPLSDSERAFLIASGVPQDSFDPERHEQARQRLVMLARETAARAAPSLDVDQVAALLGWSREVVDTAVARRHLYVIDMDLAGEVGLPAWQFLHTRPLPGLGEVVAALPESLHPLSVEGFMTTPQEDLDDRSPVDWLADGGAVAPVVRLAESLAWD